jgi:uncharacterized protein
MKIEVRVVPGAKKREIKREGSLLRVRLTSRPVEGKANEELIRLLAEAFGLKRREVTIVTGEKDRRKIVDFPVTEEQMRAVLEEAPAGQKG